MEKKYIDRNTFDFKIKPSENFDLFCNGNWKKKNKILNDYGRWALSKN